jgi:dienelactone hydrolase
MPASELIRMNVSLGMPRPRIGPTAWALAASAAVLWGADSARAVEPLTGTKPLAQQGDLASQMVAGIDHFLLDELAASVERRARHWKRDPSSAEKYNASVGPNRARLARIIGAVGPRLPLAALEYVATTAQPALVGRGDGFEVYAIRWPVLPGVEGEGLLLKPLGKKPIANVVALPDADQTPEMLVGLAAGIPPEAQFARRLAESGCRVVVPVLIDRACTYSIGAGGTRPTNQPHREFVYRHAYELGRHVIGYEVQKVLALVDWFHTVGDADTLTVADTQIGVIGYGEGGLLALYAAALDPTIDAVCTSGYFGPRENVWQEPIYRNAFGLLDEFGDAELATLVAPRTLLVEACRGPEVSGPPAAKPGAGGAAPGRIVTPTLARVEAEAKRASALVGTQWSPKVIASGDGNGLPGTAMVLDEFLAALVPNAKLAPLAAQPKHDRRDFDPAPRLKRQLDQLIDHTQRLLREAEYTRAQFWSDADRKSRSVEKWQESTARYRKYFYDEVIGRFDRPLLPPNVRTRKVYDELSYTGYDVMMDVFPNVFACGILLVPKDIKAGERRPVVVCQHGLEGRPQFVADPKVNNPAYNQYAVRLAEQGFVTYAPQNPYIFEDRFRTLQRKANPLKKTLFSIIVPQHQQATDWLASLPFVDGQRIAFYGLSYGGKTAMRVPPLVDRYCLSICSADFNEWIWKNVSARSPHSYVHSGEYEMFDFDLGNTFNYAEMAWLIAPRPFMVERGHRDGVAPDQWVAYEYARVRQLYADLKIPDRTEIEFFDGPHTIHGVGTFDFLHRHLRWPEKK